MGFFYTKIAPSMPYKRQHRNNGIHCHNSRNEVLRLFLTPPCTIGTSGYRMPSHSSHKTATAGRETISSKAAGFGLHPAWHGQDFVFQPFSHAARRVFILHRANSCLPFHSRHQARFHLYPRHSRALLSSPEGRHNRSEWWSSVSCETTRLHKIIQEPVERAA